MNSARGNDNGLRAVGNPAELSERAAKMLHGLAVRAGRHVCFAP